MRTTLSTGESAATKGEWKNIDDREIAAVEYIDWFNHPRLHGEIAKILPVEHEGQHYRHHHAPTLGASVRSLH